MRSADFGARAQVDDVGRKAAAHHQQNRADHGNAQHVGRNQIGRQRDRGIGDGGGGHRQRVVHGADHERQHDRGAMAAPARHRAVGAADRERAEAEAKHERHDDAIGVPFVVPAMCQAFSPMKCMARMPTPITSPPSSGASVKCRLPISKPTRQASDGDDQNGAGGYRLEAAIRATGSSARIEMKVEAHNAAPVPTDAMNSQP